MDDLRDLVIKKSLNRKIFTKESSEWLMTYPDKFFRLFEQSFLIIVNQKLQKNTDLWFYGTYYFS